MSAHEPAKPLLRALARRDNRQVPVWLMRQAGRYLPEYRALRTRAGSFLDLCFTPEMATEVTLQPVRRFGLDAAILFSDILVVPHGLGQKVWFEENIGPRLEPIRASESMAAFSMADFCSRLSPVYETVSRVRTVLPSEVTLIGFAGAPWTVATYMVEGGSSRDFLKTKVWAFGDPDTFGGLIDLLVEATVEHLCAQVEAGAEVLQIFESWASILAARELERWSVEPCTRIVALVRERHPHIPIILFPRGAGTGYRQFAERSGAQGLSLDYGIPLDWAAAELQDLVCIQGNLDPALLVAGGSKMEEEAVRILEALGHGPFVFNLGHGVVPQTPPEHVGRLVELVHSWRSPQSAE